MGKAIDMTRQRVGMLTVLRRAEKKHKNAYWECQCDCGGVVVVLGCSLRRKNPTQSCGCISKLSRLKTNTTHGLSKMSEYRTWGHMKARCNQENGRHFEDFKKRGIKVCDRWLNSFENFIEDMGKKPEENSTIDRINNTKGYNPDNCRWVSNLVNCQNTRVSKWWYVDGVKYKSCRDAAEKLEISCSVVCNWCNGYIRNNVFYPPKDNCWSELKYKEGSSSCS